MKPAILILLSGLFLSLSQPARAEDWSVIDSPVQTRGEVRNIVPQRTRRNNLDSVLRALDVSAPKGKTDVYPILHKVAET